MKDLCELIYQFAQLFSFDFLKTIAIVKLSEKISHFRNYAAFRKFFEAFMSDDDLVFLIKKQVNDDLEIFFPEIT
jgi:hypothetical protein